MSDIDTAALRALREAGTAGEWGSAESYDLGYDLHMLSVYDDVGSSDVGGVTEENGPLIAAAVNALVPLCDEVERLRAEVAELGIALVEASIDAEDRAMAHMEGRSEAFAECETEALQRETASDDDEAMFALGRMAEWAAEKARE